MSKDTNSFAKTVWEFFCSLRLTMFLLIFLAIISIVGTVVPQGTIPEQYLATISQTKIALYKALGFFDMYHSWWFILLLILLTVNLIACSIKRLPHIWKIITQPTLLLSDGLEKSLANRDVITCTASAEQLKEKVAASIKSNFAEPVITQEGTSWHLFAQKTPWCRLAVYVVHLSIIVIFIGALIGSLVGFKGNVNILEGDAVSRIMLRSEKEFDLGFALRLEQFSVAKYDNGAPKEFKSILTVLENGKPVPGYTNARVIVNEPLTYKGITFYQSSYGNAGNYYFAVSGADGKNPATIAINGESSATLPDGSSMHVIEATDDISQFSRELSGAAANVELHTADGKSERFVVYANYPELNAQHAKEHGSRIVINYQGAEKLMYTGLQVAKDPGVEIVWLGCLLMVIGVYVAFFMSHRRVWVRIEGGTVTIGGNASKNPGGFQQSFETLVSQLKSDLGKGDSV